MIIKTNHHSFEDNLSDQIWRKNGVYHREDGPAIIQLINSVDKHCALYWFQKGLCLKIIYSDGEES